MRRKGLGDRREGLIDRVKRGSYSGISILIYLMQFRNNINNFFSKISVRNIKREWKKVIIKTMKTMTKRDKIKNITRINNNITKIKSKINKMTKIIEILISYL